VSILSQYNKFNLTIKFLLQRLYSYFLCVGAKGANGALRYSIHPSGDPHGHFAIDGRGAVLVARPLDRESVPLYLLRVEARDGGQPALSAQATVVVGSQSQEFIVSVLSLYRFGCLVGVS
jgi:hypothetical protein